MNTISSTGVLNHVSSMSRTVSYISRAWTKPWMVARSRPEVGGSPQPLGGLLLFLQEELQEHRNRLHNQLCSIGDPLAMTLPGIVVGGKHLRAALVLSVGRLYGVDLDPFYTLASAVEMLHTASLVHDDIVDDSPRRRGRQALHHAWPVNSAVLAGDYLLGRAIASIAELGSPPLYKLFGDILTRMCEGEIRQVLRPTMQIATRNSYYRYIEAKTAALTAGMMEMAAYLSPAGRLQRLALRRYGFELGLAYQLVDDVLDITGEERRLGKPVGSDLRQGLVTMPVLCHREMVGVDDRVEAVLSGKRDERSVRKALAAINGSGAIEASLDMARVHASRCRDALALLPDNAMRSLLSDLPACLVERDC